MVQQCTVSDVPVGPLAPDRRVQAVELAVYLFLILPSLVLSLFAVGHSATRASFALAGSAVILRDAALVALVWYFLWRNGEPLGRIGWAVRHPGREIACGLALFGPMFLAAGGVDQLARAAAARCWPREAGAINSPVLDHHQPCGRTVLPAHDRAGHFRNRP